MKSTVDAGEPSLGKMTEFFACPLLVDFSPPTAKNSPSHLGTPARFCSSTHVLSFDGWPIHSTRTSVPCGPSLLPIFLCFLGIYSCSASFYAAKRSSGIFFGSGNFACGFHLVEMHHNSFVVAELDLVALVSVPLDHLIGTNPKRLQLGSRDGCWTENPDPVTLFEFQISV